MISLRDFYAHILSFISRDNKLLGMRQRMRRAIEGAAIWAGNVLVKTPLNLHLTLSSIFPPPFLSPLSLFLFHSLPLLSVLHRSIVFKRANFQENFSMYVCKHCKNSGVKSNTLGVNRGPLQVGDIF